MNREKAKRLLEVFGNPTVKIKNTLLIFARQQENDILEIELMTTEYLINEWKGLVYLNEIMSQVSLNELQRIALLQLEMKARNVEPESLNQWYAEAEKEYRKSKDV